MKQYVGKRLRNGFLHVTVDGSTLPLRSDLLRSSQAFECGCCCKGAEQLSLAVLADCLGDELACRCYRQFKFEFVTRLMHIGWEFSEQVVRDWYARTYAPAVEPTGGKP